MAINTISILQDAKLLQVFESTKRFIAEIDDIKEIQNLRNLADGFETSWKKYYRVSGLGFEQMFLGWETKVRSERRMGELLENMEKNRGAATPSHDERALSLPKLSDLGITETQSSRFQQIANVPEDKFDNKIEELRLTFKEPTTAALFSTAHVSYNSGENEWYTPPEIIELARNTMGGIDLDPASSAKANQIIRAKKYYTAKEDGLIQEWFGNVWLNPPYSQPLIEEFSKKLIDSLQTIKQACVLVNNATETGWLQPLLSHSTCSCFLKGRIRFIDKDGNRGDAPLQGQVVIYFGSNGKKFKEHFLDRGVILWTEE